MRRARPLRPGTVLLLLTLVLAGAPGPLPAAASAAPSHVAAAALDRYSRAFEEWARRDVRGRARLDLDEVRATIESSFGARASDRADVDRALLELLASLSPDLGDPPTDAMHAAVLTAAAQRLTGRGGAGFEAWVVAEVLADGRPESAPLRAAGCEALATGLRAPTVPRLAALVDDEDERVRAAALSALVGFPDLAASRALVHACERRTGDEGLRARLALGRHLEALEAAGARARAFDADLEGRLAAAALPALVADDWRAASRGVRLARSCAFEDAAPRLIEALFTWERRERLAEGPAELVGVRRVRHELADALRAGSGLALGVEPQRWMQWWRARRSGEERPRVASRTVVPDFFGLELRSGAVAFVIDASGSMDHPVPGRYADGRGPTRFEEAQQQLALALERLPEPSVVQVVLFDDVGRRWSDEPRLVDSTSRSSIRTWLRRRPPSGGTSLSAGLEALLPRDAEGRVDVAALGVDTVVVLCDGETAEDAAWARAWLRATGDRALLVFHCVQIGGSRADALRTLAEETGGQFVRVGS